MAITQHTAVQTYTCCCSTQDFSYTLASGGCDVALVIGFAVEATTVNSVTWDVCGTCQTMCVGINILKGGTSRAGIWFLKNPTRDGSSKTLRVGLQNAKNSIAFIKAYAGVDTKNNCNSESPNCGNPSISITSVCGSMIINMEGAEDNCVTTHCSQTELVNTSNSIVGAGSQELATGNPTVMSMTHSDTGKKFVHVGIELTELSDAVRVFRKPINASGMI